MREVVLRLAKSDSWISTLHASQRANVRILDCRPTDGGSLTVLVEVSAPDTELDGIFDEIRQSPDVTDPRLIKTKRGRMLGTVIMKGHSVAKAVLETGAFCRSCFLLEPAGPDGTVEWRIALDNDRPIETLLEKMRSAGMDPEVRSVARASGSQELTRKQEFLLELAVEKGYYNFPRKISITELARLAGISVAAASEVLRGAEKKIVHGYVLSKREKQNNHAHVAPIPVN